MEMSVIAYPCNDMTRCSRKTAQGFPRDKRIPAKVRNLPLLRFRGICVSGGIAAGGIGASQGV